MKYTMSITLTAPEEIAVDPNWVKGGVVHIDSGDFESVFYEISRHVETIVPEWVTVTEMSIDTERNNPKYWPLVADKPVPVRIRAGQKSTKRNP